MLPKDEMPLMIPEKTILIGKMMRSSNVFELSELANWGVKVGAVLIAASYLAAYRIYEIYQRVEQVADGVLLRHLKMRESVVPTTGSTGLRRHYNLTFNGWESYNAWLEDWVSDVPVSRSSAYHKVWDIEGWRNDGASWSTILKLLANTPMAGRDALQKPVQAEALPSGGMAQYYEELAELPPGQARKKVSEDSGEMQIWAADTQWHDGRLLLKVILEDKEGIVPYDLIISQVSNNPSWMAIAHWLAGKLGKKLLIGG